MAMTTDDEGARLPVDRSADPNQGHLLPIDELAPETDPDRRLLVFQPAAPRAIEWTAERLVTGGVVAFPTDTVYAVAASLAHPAALRRIFALKGRPADRPLPVLLASPAALDRVALAIDPRVTALLARYWPGPLTAVVPARAGMPPEVLGPDGTVGARVPNHPLALELLERAGGAVAATSANRTGDPPARTGDEVAETLGDALDVLLDGGLTPGGVPSTVATFQGDDLRILREGAIPHEHLAAAWREILAAGAG